MFEPYRLDTVTSFHARVSSGGIGGTIQVRVGSPTGTVLGSATVPVTGGWETFTTVTGAISGAPATTGRLYLTFAGGTGALFDVDAFGFVTGAANSGPVVGMGGKCLDVRNAATADGTQIQIYTCNGTAAQIQLWTCNGSGAQVWSAQADGTVRNPQSGKCLDVSGNTAVDGQAVHLWTCHAGANQKWTLP